MPPPGAEPRPPRGGWGAPRLWALALGAGALATLVSWLLIEASLNTFKPTATPMDFMSSTYMIVQSDQREAAGLRNAVLAFGLMGAAVGLALALAGGLAGRSLRSSNALPSTPLALGLSTGLEGKPAGFWLVAALLGLGLGAVVGAASAHLTIPIANRLQLHDQGNALFEMASSMLVHCGVWAAVGAAGGLVFGISLGGTDRALRGMLGGLLGGMAGGVLYELIGALILPGAKIVSPIATSRNLRLLAQALAVLPAAIGVAALVSQPRREQAAPGTAR
jgi:hypothetical protein